MVKWGYVLRVALLLIVAATAAIMLAQPIGEAINLGLDLQGGTHLVLELVDAPEAPVDEEAVQAVLHILRQRVDGFGVQEPVIQRQGERRIIVELPGLADPDEAIEVLAMTAHLEFRDEEGQVLMTGRDLEDASFVYDEYNRPAVGVEFRGESAQEFAEVTREQLGRSLVIVLDDEIISAPVVQEPILDGQAQITGIPSAEEAQNIALGLRSGALPVGVEVIENRTVGPQLGEESVQQSLLAFGVGIIAVLVAMLVLYRLAGLVADLALGIYVLLVAGALAFLEATLTLPGIAGLILSIGMAVDANVIIFERIKEEVNWGKTLRASIEGGFRRAFRTILDANLTTLIVAGVLFYFGTGPIRGFAVTLSIGILCSMVTALIITRLLLVWLVESRLVRPQAYFRTRKEART